MSDYEDRLDRIELAFERMQQRHQALAETVEVLAGMQRQNENRFELIARNFETVLDSIKRLENIARSHEQRLEDLEGGSQ